MLQVRNVPRRLHRRLKARAARQGKTLSSYVLGILERADREMSIDEWLEQLRRLPPTKLNVSVADLIREGRRAG